MCFADPRVYDIVVSMLLNTFNELEEVKKKVKAGEKSDYYTWIHRIEIELRVLYEDLMAWRPSEEVCYDEFITKIRRIREEIRAIKREIR